MRGAGDRMLRARVLTVVLGLPPFLVCLWLGNWAWVSVVLVVAVGGGLEATRLLQLERRGLPLALAGAAGTVLAAGGGERTLALTITLIVLLSLAMDAVFFPRSPGAGRVILAALYPALGLAHMVLLRQISGDWAWCLFLLAVVWMSDIGAYFGGYAWGRHRLAPRLSPGKSWEGFLGGLGAAALVGTVVGYTGSGLLSAQTGGGGVWLTPGWTVGLSLVVALAGAAGDLAESALKRAAGKKDSGWLLPGHGGFLDRFDSLVFAAPLLYWLYVYLR